MNEYQPEERVTLFDESTSTSDDDDSSTAIINRFTTNRRRNFNSTKSTSRYPSTTTTLQQNQWSSCNNQNLRTRLNKFCPSCGTYGHDISVNGCDFTACLLKALDYIKHNPHNLKQILDFHYQYQGQRRKSLQHQGTTSNCLRTMARKKKS